MIVKGHSQLCILLILTPSETPDNCDPCCSTLCEHPALSPWKAAALLLPESLRPNLHKELHIPGDKRNLGCNIIETANTKYFH